MRTEQTLERICEELQKNVGDTLAACKAVGVSLIFLNQWRKDDKIVHERVQEAERVGVQGLVSAAIQRAVHGVDKDVYFKGIVVGQQKEYSDGLLNTLLKAKLPEFAAGEGGGVQVNVNVANVMPRANNYDEWMAMKERTLSPPPEALPAPSEPIDVEFVEVQARPFAGIDL